MEAGIRARSHEYLVCVLFSLAGSLVYAFVPLLTKVLKSVTSFALPWWQCLVGTILTAWWPVLYGWPTQLDSVVWLIGLGTIHTGLAYALMFAGFSRLNTGRLAVLQFVYPMTAFVIDWQVYGHTLSIVQIVGLVLMALAVLSVKRGS